MILRCEAYFKNRLFSCLNFFLSEHAIMVFPLNFYKALNLQMNYLHTKDDLGVKSFSFHSTSQGTCFRKPRAKLGIVESCRAHVLRKNGVVCACLHALPCVCFSVKLKHPFMFETFSHVETYS